MTKRYKATSIFSLIIVFVLCCAFICLPFVNKKQNKVLAETSDNSLYAFVSRQDDKVINGKIYVDFGISIDVSDDGDITRSDVETMVENKIVPFESAKIYIRTRNISAISEQGDYEAIDQSVTVLGNSPYMSLAVKVNNVGLQVNGVARQFYVEIYKVEITGLNESYTFHQPNTTKEISSKTLSTGAALSIGQQKSTYISGDYLYNLDLGYYSYDVWESLCRDVTTNTFFDDIRINLANVSNGWYNKVKYLSDNDMAKLGIRVVMSSYEEANSVYTDNSFVGVQVFGGDSKNVGAPALEGVPSKNVYSSDSVVELARWYAKFQSDERESTNVADAFNGEFEGVTVGTMFNENVLIAKSLGEKDSSRRYYGAGGVYDSNVGSMDDNLRKNVFLIDDLNTALKGSTTVSTRVWSYLSSKKKFYAGTLMFIPTNYRARVESATFGQIYKDENGKDKVGVSLRFSEPVQFINYKDGRTVAPYLEGYINGNAANGLTFNYVSGVGTDTLFFETDVSNYKMNITRIALKSARGFESVYDFAPKSPVAGVTGASQHLNVMDKVDGKNVNGWDTISTQSYSCSYDLREPEVDISSNVSQTVKTSHTVTVRTANIGETGSLYYAWTTDNENEPKNLIRETISPQGFQTISSPSNISGKRYLYVVAVSDFGKRSAPQWYGPFHFDNDKPTIKVKCLNATATNYYKQKDFQITIVNKSPTIENFDKYAELKKNLKLCVASDERGVNIVKEFPITLSDENLKNESVTVNYTLNASALDLAINSEKEFGEYYIFFSVSDVLDNQGITEPTSYYFDVREIFTASLTKNDYAMDEFTADKLSLEENNYTIDLSKIGTNKTIVFTAESSIVMGIESFVNVKSNVGVISSVNVNGGNGRVEISINEKFTAGLYRLTLKDNADGSNKKSLPIYFYVTDGKDSEGGRYVEETGGYQSLSDSAAFTNKVFQIPTSIPYYYMTETGEEVKESYCDGNRPAIFSSWGAAHSYILYREYLDLYAVTLTQTLANDLNRGGGIGVHRKADGVTKIAAEGQVWIRYKEVNWSPNSTTSDWVYYYYGENQSSLPINVNALSNELQIALNTVANMICSHGEELNLVTEEYLDQYGAPMLRPEQIHLHNESSDKSRNGTPFEEDVEYLGDTGLHLFLDVDAPLLTNAPIPFAENRYLYYKTESGEYRALTKDNRKTFGEYFNATGRFTILELDENGAREYDVYVDKTAPTLEVSWKVITETETRTESKTFSMDDNGETISGSNFCIESITDYDALSFVAIYRYTTQGEGDLISVYRKSDFDKGQDARLEDGKYYVHVADRSGNSYIFVLQVKSAPLVFTVREVENSYIRVELNRDESEVRYQVYLDGRLLTSNFADKRFTESGEYRFVIEDIYGNIYNETYRFERDLPVVSWRYQISDGSYVSYEEDSSQIKLQKLDEQNYVISTSTYLRFLPLDGCIYEIVSGNPNPSKNVASGWITLNNKVPFTMKVYYESSPEICVTYTCTVDDSAPNISVSYKKESYKAFELDEIKAKMNAGEFSLGDNPFTPTFIGFTSDENSATTLYVDDGQRVQGKYFKVQASDESGVKDVKIYCDGNLLLTKESDFSNIYVSRRGSYQIVATDNFGNTTTMSFINDYEELADYFVDGEQISTDVSFVDNFVGETYTKVEYGNSQAGIKILASAEVQYLITGEDGKAYHFAFIVEDGKIYTFQYLIQVVKGEKVDENGEKVVVDEIENISSRGINALTSGVIAKIDELGVAISLSKNNDGSISLTVQSTDERKKTYTVETRISPLENQNETPYYFKTEISTIPSSITFADENGNEIPASQTIKVNKSFVVRDTLANEIQSIEVAFSTSGNYSTYKTVYDGTYHRLVFKDEGMYHVKVVNRYGIQTDYYVVISSQFVMNATVEHTDGTTIAYSTDYTKEHDDFYSNKSVEFIVYATNIKVFPTGNAVSVIPSEQGYTTIYINTLGEYHLTIEDEYGNKMVKNIFIKADSLSIDENILTNFNEKALRRDENYTNQNILINKKAVSESEIAFIRMIYGDKAVTVFDKVSEVKTEFDENQFVGALGDGEYTLVFKDCYGNKTEIVIHYRATPTLTIERTTLNGVGVETYPIEEMLSYGVWTNDSVRFSISASEYVLRVDGKDNVKSISYDTKTKNEYEVYYLDEYGFEYTFKVYLHREDVVITPAQGMSVSQISDMLVTKDSVKILFTENALCSYTLNNEPEKTYSVGDVLYKDGVYRFKVVDKAGNVSTYTVKKDSAVEYRLEGAGISEVLVNGGVTNSHSVKFFAANTDSAYIKKVFHNNALIEYDSETFTERGKWELIVADDAGNESYFRFYIIYGKIDGFSYNTPYNYVITSVVWEMEDSIAEATETIKEQGLRLEATENGKYTVTMQSLITGDIKSFTFTIDKTPPQVELLGCEQDEKTINNVTLKGCTVGDTIYVYRDGELVKTARIDSDYMDPPTIDEAGKYTIVVENEAGVQTELSFERKYIPNVAGSILIIVLALASVVGLFVGLVWRNHSKTDD